MVVFQEVDRAREDALTGRTTENQDFSHFHFHPLCCSECDGLRRRSPDTPAHMFHQQWIICSYFV